jgi:hypothetical protein
VSGKRANQPPLPRTSHGLCFKLAVHNKILFLLLILAFGLNLNGCVSMSPQARRERAYRHYVQKQMKARQRAVARAQKEANRQLKAKMRSVEPSEPKITTSVESVPELPSEPVSDSKPEPITDPITVSASAPMPAESESVPAQP